jgi:hypothetical protein
LRGALRDQLGERGFIAVLLAEFIGGLRSVRGRLCDCADDRAVAIDYILKRCLPLAASSMMAASASATMSPSGPFATGATRTSNSASKPHGPAP